MERVTLSVRGLSEPSHGCCAPARSPSPGPYVTPVLNQGFAFFYRWLVRPPTRPVVNPILIAPAPYHGAARGYKSLPATRTVHVNFAGTNTLTGEAKATRTAGRLREIGRASCRERV